MREFTFTFLFANFLGIFYNFQILNRSFNLEYFLPLPFWFYYSYNMFKCLKSFTELNTSFSNEVAEKNDFFVLTTCCVINIVKLFHYLYARRNFMNALDTITVRSKKLIEKTNTNFTHNSDTKLIFLFVIVVTLLISQWKIFSEGKEALEFYLSYVLTVLYNLLEQIITCNILKENFRSLKYQNKSLTLNLKNIKNNSNGKLKRKISLSPEGEFRKIFLECDLILELSYQTNKIFGFQQLLTLTSTFILLVSYVYYYFIFLRNITQSLLDIEIFCCFWILIILTIIYFLVLGWSEIRSEVSLSIN